MKCKFLVLLSAAILLLLLCACTYTGRPSRPENHVQPSQPADSPEQPSQPETSSREAFRIDTLQDCFALLGTPMEEVSFPPRSLDYLGSEPFSADIESSVFGYKATGSFSFDTSEDKVVFINRCYLYINDLGLEDCVELLQEEYGDYESSGEIPYAAVNGGAVTWYSFETNYGTLRVSAATNHDYLTLELTRPD